MATEHEIRADYGDIQAVFSRRQSPEDSLFLLKAVGSVPHRGGKRTSIGSPEYETSGVNGLLGIDSDTILRTPSGRPVKIINEDGPIIREAIA